MNAFLPWSHGYWTTPNAINLPFLLWCVVSVMMVGGAALEWLNSGDWRPGDRAENARIVLATSVIALTGTVLWPIYLGLVVLAGIAFLLRDALPPGTFSGRKERREIKAAERRIKTAKKIAEMEREAGIR